MLCNTAAVGAFESEMMAKNVMEFGPFLFSAEMMQKIQVSQLRCGQDMLKKAEARHKDVLKAVEERHAQVASHKIAGKIYKILHRMMRA